MSRITITSRDAERIARSFNDLIKPTGLNRIRRLAVGKVGSQARKQTRAVLPGIIGTSAAALSIVGKAPAPGSDNPSYKLRFAARIPVARLKAKRRRITRRRGIASLALTLPGGKTVRFKSVHREGARFRLLRAGPLPERTLGSVYPNPRQAFERYEELGPIRRRAERALPGIVAALIEAHMKGRKS